MTPEEKKEHCEQWYAVRWERLHSYAKGLGEPHFSDICSIMGNGTLTGALQKRGEAPGYEPPTYAQIMNRTIHKLEAANASVDRAENQRDSLILLIRDIDGWIKNWNTPFTEDDEWAETQAKIDLALL